MPSHRVNLVPLLGCIALLAGCPGESSPQGEPEPDAGEAPLDGGNERSDDPEDEDEDEDESASQPLPAADGGSSAGTDKPTPPKQPATDKPAADKPAMNPGSTDQTPSKPAGMVPPPTASSDPQRFFLPTPQPRNTQTPRIELDRRGGLHAAYPASAGNGAFYAYCPNGCADPRAMKSVELPTDGIPSSALLALTADGKPRVLIPTYLRVYYAECDQNCSESSSWTTSVIVDHQSQQDVSGEAFALDSKGHPRFIMHTYVAYLGVGQKEPHSYYAQCDQGCTNPANWSIDTIYDQIFQYSNMHIDAADRVHLGTVIIDPASSIKQISYLRCDSDCASSDSWFGIQLAPAFENSFQEIRPSVSLALTSSGGARLAALVMPDAGARSLAYFECDQNCDEDNWNAAVLSNAYELGSGVDIAVDAQDRPRLAFTLDDNIGIYHCDASHCTTESSTWDLAKVEFASDLTPDTIILWPNCVADAWLLHDPTLVLDQNGAARVGYQATDVSGGFNNNPDPNMTPCLVGKDMTLARMALMPAL